MLLLDFMLFPGQCCESADHFKIYFTGLAVVLLYTTLSFSVLTQYHERTPPSQLNTIFTVSLCLNTLLQQIFLPCWANQFHGSR